MGRAILAALPLLLLIIAPAYAWTGKVSHVVDGDTIDVLHDGDRERIRLYGIDTPERGQFYYKQAKEEVRRLVAGKTVTVEPYYLDNGNPRRTVATISIDGLNINQHLVQAGYAIVHQKYCTKDICNSWKNLEATAKMQEKGMWPSR
jgi:endonuclease YncB( thermonuclease family)